MTSPLRTQQRIELPRHSSRTTIGVKGFGAILFGLVFVAVGGGVCYVAYSDVGGKNAPVEIIAAVGVVFAVAGLFVAGQAVRGTMARARLSKVMDPVLGDYPWVRTHASHNSYGKAVSGFVGFLFMGLFLVPFNWWAFMSGSGGFFVTAIVGLFDVLLVAILWTAIHSLSQATKYGTSALRFEAFPFLLGQHLGARFECSRRIDSDKGIQVTLRCIEEAIETRGPKSDRSRQVVSYQVYGDSLQIDAKDAAAGTATKFAIDFELPEADLETQLNRQPPRYWEVEVKSETPGVDFAATFLVPVYSASTVR